MFNDISGISHQFGKETYEVLSVLSPFDRALASIKENVKTLREEIDSSLHVFLDSLVAVVEQLDAKHVCNLGNCLLLGLMQLLLVLLLELLLLVDVLFDRLYVKIELDSQLLDFSLNLLHGGNLGELVFVGGDLFVFDLVSELLDGLKLLGPVSNSLLQLFLVGVGFVSLLGRSVGWLFLLGSAGTHFNFDFKFRL